MRISDWSSDVCSSDLRSALNENYDANMWGAELELAWRPTPRLRINGNVGYLDTRIANGMKSMDVMNRTQGNAEWTVIKPWMQLASNCIAPKSLVETILSKTSDITYLQALCGRSNFGDYYRLEEHTSELQSLMRISYAVFY